MSDRYNISVEQLRQLIEYSPSTGLMRWKHRPADLFVSQSAAKTWNARYADKPAFTAISGGYRNGAIFGVMYRCCRVAWALNYGKWPSGEIDHINGVKNDDSASNLRCVSHLENMQNIGTPKDNLSGAMGVIFDKSRGKWMAFIRLNKTQKTLGRFNDFESACLARKTAEIKYGFHENHGRKTA
jgi:HNH endonuclease